MKLCKETVSALDAEMIGKGWIASHGSYIHMTASCLHVCAIPYTTRNDRLLEGADIVFLGASGGIDRISKTRIEIPTTRGPMAVARAIERARKTITALRDL